MEFKRDKQLSESNLVKFIKDWLIPVICAFILAVLINKFFIFKVEIPSRSMVPTVNVGDQIFVKRVYDTSKLERGNIVVFKKDGEKTLLFKRIIGLPGENVEIKNDGAVFVNGKQIDEPYVKYPDSLTGVFTVPMDSFFMMGDNRAESSDSRMWKDPYIPAENIEAQAGLRVYPFNNMGILK